MQRERKFKQLAAYVLCSAGTAVLDLLDLSPLSHGGFNRWMRPCGAVISSKLAT